MTHIAAIHTLKSKLAMSDGDYRLLLMQLTGRSSSKDCTPAQQRTVREHLQYLAGLIGVAGSVVGVKKPKSEPEPLSPREKKIWALWYALHKRGIIASASAAALRAFVKRQTGCDAMRFCTTAQLDIVIEALKAWQRREAEGN